MLHAPSLPSLPLSNMPIVLAFNSSQPTPSALQLHQDPQHPPTTESEPAAAPDQRGRLRQSSRRTLSSQSLVRLKKDVEASLLFGNKNEDNNNDNNNNNSDDSNNGNNNNNSNSPAAVDTVVAAGDLQESDFSESSKSPALTVVSSARLGRNLLPSHSRCPSPTPSGAATSSSSSSPVLSSVNTITTRSAVVANCRPFVASAILVPVSVCAHASPLLDIGNTESFSGNEPVPPTATSTTTPFSTATTARSLQERRGKENYLPEPRGTRVSRSSSTASTGRASQRPSDSETLSCVQVESSNTASSDATNKHTVMPPTDNAVAAMEQRNRVRASTTQATSGRMTETVGESHTASGGEMGNRPRDPLSPGLAIPPAPAVVDVTEKPAISYANLILQAISESPLQRLTLCDIYAWIKDRHPYYQYSSSGWQNSIRHNLSLNKAFQKLERNMGEPGKGCFWTLHEDAHAICAASACKKTKKSDELPSENVSMSRDQTSSGMARSKSTSASLPRLNCQRQDLRRLTPKRSSSTRALTPPESVSGLHTSGNAAPLSESVHSPAASEDTEEPMSPRRSGRARRPPRAKEIDEYTVHTPSGASSLSTPPWSPGRDDSDDEEKADGHKESLESSPADSTLLSPHEAKAKATTVAQASAPVTSHRIRRPPQNLADFVSSEDFKAAPYTKRPVGRPPLTNAASSPNLIADRDRLERKRSRDDLCKSLENDHEQSEPHSNLFDRDVKRERSASSAEPTSAPSPMCQGPDSTSLPRPPLLHRPASVSLSALSHSKRPSEDFSSRNGKKQRRDAERRHQERQRSRSGSRSRSSENVFERRRREGKREIMVVSEDDWSDSDFDCLRDEEENYRMNLRRAGLDDRRHAEGFAYNCGDGLGSQSNGVGLLLDPSAITYGFDSCDAEYILNFNQGPLFNNVSWPEFSDSKEDALVPASSMADQNEAGSQELDYIQKEWALLTANISQSPGSPTDELLLLNNIDLEADEDSPNRSETPEMQLPLRLEDCAMEAAHAVSELNKIASSCSPAKEDDGEFLKDYIGWSLCD